MTQYMVSITDTVWSRSSDPFCIVTLLYKIGHYFLDIQQYNRDESQILAGQYIKSVIDLDLESRYYPQQIIPRRTVQRVHGI